MTLSTQPYKGARDFYPEDKRLQKYMFGVMREVVEKFGYEEYDAPILEPVELFAAKTGDEIVNEQTYIFEDRGGRKVAIRPEMTPSVSRMVAGKRQELAYPLRWYSIPNFWRYERPQKGRSREFWQLNVDLFGVEDLSADQEIVTVADAIMRAYGGKPDMYTIRVNSRRLMNAFMADYLELNEVQVQTLAKLIDKFHKIPFEEFLGLAEALLTPSQREKGEGKLLQTFLETKSLDNLPDSLKNNESALQLAELLTRLEEAGISNVEFDPTLMRGLDYYTDIVFEVFDTSPENNRSMFGGGRYDGLVELFGVDKVPSVGFAMGDLTLKEFLTGHELLPDLKSETEIYAIIIGDVADQAQRVLSELREMGVNVAVDLTGRKTDKQLKTAVKKGIGLALFIGKKELEDDQYVLKDLLSQKEERLSIQRIVSTIKDFRK